MTDTELQHIADQEAAVRLNTTPSTPEIQKPADEIEPHQETTEEPSSALDSTLSNQLAAIRFSVILRIVGMVLLAILAWSFIAGTILSTIYLIGILIASLL